MLHKDIYIYNTDILGQNQEGDYIIVETALIVKAIAGLISAIFS